MSEGKVLKLVVIQNPQGLHARPASLFVKLSTQYPCEVWVSKGATCVDGKSILEMLALGAACGETIQIECRGEQADVAAEVLAELIGQVFDE